MFPLNFYNYYCEFVNIMDRNTNKIKMTGLKSNKSRQNLSILILNKIRNRANKFHSIIPVSFYLFCLLVSCFCKLHFLSTVVEAGRSETVLPLKCEEARPEYVLL